MKLNAGLITGFLEGYSALFILKYYHRIILNGSQQMRGRMEIFWRMFISHPAGQPTSGWNFKA